MQNITKMAISAIALINAVNAAGSGAAAQNISTQDVEAAKEHEIAVRQELRAAEQDVEAAKKYAESTLEELKEAEEEERRLGGGGEAADRIAKAQAITAAAYTELTEASERLKELKREADVKLGKRSAADLAAERAAEKRAIEEGHKAADARLAREHAINFQNLKAYLDARRLESEEAERRWIEEQEKLRAEQKKLSAERDRKELEEIEAARKRAAEQYAAEKKREQERLAHLYM